MLVISCHADTGFSSHALTCADDGTVTGNLDNFAGVHAVMKAYFSGRINRGDVRIALTHGEEVDFAGAFDVLETLGPDDLVVVVDVTGAPTDRDFTVEKCRNPRLTRFLQHALAGLSCDLYEGCPDPVSTLDEVNVYERKCRYTCFLGVPCRGGDYNLGAVTCSVASIDAVSEALCRIAEAHPRFALLRDLGEGE